MTGTNMTGAGRYKLIRLLDQAEGYAAYSALDIEQSTRPQVLINVYSGHDAIRSMVERYYGMSSALCRDYCRTFTEDGAFMTVFSLHDGEEFEASFPKRGGPDEKMRAEYAETLLHAALENSGMPPELLTEMLQMRNVVVQEKNRRVMLNAGLRPVSRDPQPASCALSPLLERILGRRWSACDEQIAFMDAAQEGRLNTVSALYSAWRELVPIMQRDWEKTAFLSKVWRAIKRWWRSFVKKRRQRRKERRAALEE